jgi:hypothetical protein
VTEGHGAPGETFIISLLPRGRAGGRSALVALDAATLDMLAVRTFPPEEYLDDIDAAPVEHARGLAQHEGRLLVALFNCVRSYEIDDLRCLDMRPGALFTSPAAVDIHGLDVHGGMLFAGSTGADAVITWNLVTGETATDVFSGTVTADLRFPHREAFVTGATDWRAVLPTCLHVNDVSAFEDSIVVCSLRNAWLAAGASRRTLLADEHALLHDGRLCSDGRLLFTDAARGHLVTLPFSSGAANRIVLTDPGRWFLRGLRQVGSHAAVLRSERVSSLQRAPRRTDNEVAPGGACFGISIVDLATGKIEEDRVLTVDAAPAGSVAYAVLAL